MMIKNKNQKQYKLIMLCMFMVTFGVVKADNKKLTKKESKRDQVANASKDTKVSSAVLKPIKKLQSNKTIVSVSAADKEKEKSSLELDNSLLKARWEHQYGDLIAEIERLRLEREYRRLCKEIEEETFRNEHEKEIRLLIIQKEKLIAELELVQTKFNKQMTESSNKVAALEKQAQLTRAETQILQESKNQLQTEIDVFQTEVQRSKYLKKNPIYLKDPVRKRDNILVLSDRCIQLNGYIMPWVANKVVDQIQYFNKQNAIHPIFLIIEESPGGSVISGWHIIQAMKHSKAPVYVVLKRFAASMAACIVTLATKSYAFPNAQILHHQPWSFWCGNTRESREYAQYLEEIWKRTGGFIAKKMGITLHAFEQKLYKKSARGDWMEFADNAKKLKWIDEVIVGIEESGMSIMPNPDEYTAKNWYKEYCPLWEGKNKEQCVYYTTAPYDYDYSYKPFKLKR